MDLLIPSTESSFVIDISFSEEEWNAGPQATHRPRANHRPLCYMDRHESLVFQREYQGQVPWGTDTVLLLTVTVMDNMGALKFIYDYLLVLFPIQAMCQPSKDIFLASHRYFGILTSGVKIHAPAGKHTLSF